MADDVEKNEGAMDFLQVKEMVGEREIIRMKFDKIGVDVNILPPTPRHSPPPPEGCQLPKIKYKPLDLDIPPGKDAVFELVVKDNTDTSVSWSKDKNLLFCVGKYKMWNKGNSYFFKITNVTEKDESLYDYVVRNKYGEKKGDVQLLINEDSDYEDDDGAGEEEEEKQKTGKVVLQPCFLQRLKHEYVISEGQPLELLVETEGKPDDISWFYEGRKLKNTGSDFITITSEKNIHRLYIAETVDDDEGFYELVASYGDCVITTSADVVIETTTQEEEDIAADMNLDYEIKPSSVIQT